MTTSRMCWLLLCFVLFAALYSANTEADISIHAGGWSQHIVTGDTTDYTSSHDLIGLEVGPTIFATFRNSYGRRSQLVAYGHSRQWDDWQGSIHVGIMRGYTSCYGDDGDKPVLCPIIFPSIYYTKYPVQPGFILFGEALTFSFRITF